MKKLFTNLFILCTLILTMNTSFACDKCNCPDDCCAKCDCAKVACDCGCQKGDKCTCNCCKDCDCKNCCNGGCDEKRILKIFKKKCKCK